MIDFQANLFLPAVAPYCIKHNSIAYYMRGWWEYMAHDQTINVTVQLDKELKASGEALFSRFGVSFSSAINALLKEAIQQGKNPLECNTQEPLGFEYSAELEADDPFFNQAAQAEIHRRIADIEANGDAVLEDFNPLEKMHV
jgi:addiction module RelB/DinJ family antitoxin